MKVERAFWGEGVVAGDRSANMAAEKMGAPRVEEEMGAPRSAHPGYERRNKRTLLQCNCGSSKKHTVHTGRNPVTGAGRSVHQCCCTHCMSSDNR